VKTHPLLHRFRGHGNGAKGLGSFCRSQSSDSRSSVLGTVALQSSLFLLLVYAVQQRLHPPSRSPVPWINVCRAIGARCATQRVCLGALNLLSSTPDAVGGMRQAQQRLRALAGDAWRGRAALEECGGALAPQQQLQNLSGAARRFLTLWSSGSVAARHQQQPAAAAARSLWLQAAAAQQQQHAAAAARLWPPQQQQQQQQLRLLATAAHRCWAAAAPSRQLPAHWGRDAWQLQWRACKHSHEHGTRGRAKSITDNGLYLVSCFVLLSA
jgi:hypothetical protein